MIGHFVNLIEDIGDGSWDYANVVSQVTVVRGAHRVRLSAAGLAVRQYCDVITLKRNKQQLSAPSEQRNYCFETFLP